MVDIGKTLSKVSLWSRDGQMLDRQMRPNAPVELNGLRRLDTAGIGNWLSQVLPRYREHPVEYVVPVGHGAGVVALRDGAPTFAPLDYEQELPAEVAGAYRDERDPFGATGSPALPCGLNFGAQLALIEARDPGALDDVTLMPWAQYWAWWLSGAAVSEATWDPLESTCRHASLSIL